MSPSFSFSFALAFFSLKYYPKLFPVERKRHVSELSCCICMHAGAARRAESARVFTIINQCKTVIWPAVTPGESFGGGGFALRPGQSMVVGPRVGPHGLQLRRWRERLLRHGFMRQRAQVRVVGRDAG